VTMPAILRAMAAAHRAEAAARVALAELLESQAAGGESAAGDYLSREQFAARYGAEGWRSIVRAAHAAGATSKLGRRTLISSAYVESYLASRHAAPAPSPNATPGEFLRAIAGGAR